MNVSEAMQLMSQDSDMADVEHLNFIHTTHIQYRHTFLTVTLKHLLNSIYLRLWKSYFAMIYCDIYLFYCKSKFNL